MNPKQRSLVLIVMFSLSLFTEITYAQGPGGPEAGGPGASPEKPAPKPRVRWQKPLQLPEKYRSKDTNKDGQIGLYEWDRRDYATFRKLDLNHDGFLTAEELNRGASSKSTPTVAASKTEPSDKSAASSSRPAAAPAVTATGDAAADKPVPPAGEADATTPVPGPTAGLSDVEKQWVILDKDKDGKVSEAEWGRSYLARPRFRDAGIAVTFPLGKDEFIQLYSQLPSAGK
jgi:hypothetical protein